jgi:hypothetical protein
MSLAKFDSVLLHIAKYAEKLPQQAVTTAGALVTVVTGGCMVSSATNHQAGGNILNVLEGVADCSEERYSSEGGAEPGSLCTNAGKFIRSVGINGYNFLLSNGKFLAKLAPQHIKALGYITNALFVAEAASMVDEATRGDGKKVEDKADLLDNGLNILALAMTRKRLMGFGCA